eukprot:gb/GECH01001483.1/.p1 GENE.gb/GECH01001483.1/~~gb/GECH01001483.1/.p1  ORF type:complete len:929 (+),score=128.64 gb/GECH01001483.1/:1-2787(+)
MTTASNGLTRLIDYFVVVGPGNAFHPIQVDGPSPEYNLNDADYVDPRRVTFRAQVEGRYPTPDREHKDSPLSPDVAMFCLPDGVRVDYQRENPAFFTFVLTGVDGAHTYGSCIAFSDYLTSQQQSALLHVLRSLARVTSDDGSDTTDEDEEEDTDNDIPLSNDEIEEGKDNHEGSDTTHDKTDQQHFSNSIDSNVTTEGNNNRKIKQIDDEGSDLKSTRDMDESETANEKEYNTVIPQSTLPQKKHVVYSSSSSSNPTQHNSTIPLDKNDTSDVHNEERKASSLLYITRCICIVSHHPLFSAFRKLLEHIYNCTSDTGSTLPIERYICNFVDEIPLPPRGRVRVQATVGENMLDITRPPPNQLPMCDVPIEHLFLCLSVENVLTVFNAVLQERQIVLQSEHLSLLSTVSHAIVALMFPLHWHYVFIPLTPRPCTTFLAAPVPFLMGVPKQFLVPEDIQNPEILVVDLDHNRIRDRMHPPMTPLPPKQGGKLRQKLVNLVGNTHSPETGRKENFLSSVGDITRSRFALNPPFPTDDVRQVFLRFFVSLFRRYRSFVLDENEASHGFELPFNKEGFIKESSQSARSFVRKMVETQGFQRFIFDRIEGVNTWERILFDESIEAKANRSIFVIHKRDTPFLNDTTYRITRTVVAPAPNTSHLPEGGPPYQYTAFPLLNAHHFVHPRDVEQLVDLGEEAGESSETLDSWRVIMSTLAALSRAPTHKGRKKRYSRKSLFGHTGSWEGSELSELSDMLSASDRPENGSGTSAVSLAGATVYLETAGSAKVAETLTMLRLETHNQCPQCGSKMEDGEVQEGWTDDPNDYRTTCPDCGMRFVPRFTIHTKEHNGRQRRQKEADNDIVSRPEYLSPVVLRKEIRNLVKHNVSADEGLIEHPAVFWGLVKWSRDLHIPLNFLLPQVRWESIVHSLCDTI